MGGNQTEVTRSVTGGSAPVGGRSPVGFRSPRPDVCPPRDQRQFVLHTPKLPDREARSDGWTRLTERRTEYAAKFRTSALSASAGRRLPTRPLPPDQAAMPLEGSHRPIRERTKSRTTARTNDHGARTRSTPASPKRQRGRKAYGRPSRDSTAMQKSRDLPRNQATENENLFRPDPATVMAEPRVLMGPHRRRRCRRITRHWFNDVGDHAGPEQSQCRP
jgi:hypothetical protein